MCYIAQVSTLNSNTLRNFLRRFRSDPDDETHLLVFADWLEEHGDPRAELIRLHVETFLLGDSDPLPDCPRRERYTQLYFESRRNFEVLQQELESSGCYHSTPDVARIGFVDRLVCPTETFVQCRATIFQRVPTIFELVLWGTNTTWLTQLAQCRELEHVQCITLHKGVEDPVSSTTKGWTALFQSSYLRNLERLSVRAGAAFTDTAAGALLRELRKGKRGRFPHLRRIDLSETDVSADVQATIEEVLQKRQDALSR